jgi:endonuclease/exonuclease/phosphatase family metal-dependent hydrolase
MLERLDCDVLLLNEVPRDSALVRVASTLGMQLAYAPAQWMGNALLARAPLNDAGVITLDTRRAETRSAVHARLVIGGVEMRVVCTHLDEASEASRVEQLERLVRIVADDGMPHLIGGDLNALRLADYPPEVLATIREARTRGSREGPSNDAVALLDARRYLDAARLADSGAVGYAASLKRPLAASLRSTCWAGTRVDYLWLSEDLAERVKDVQASVTDTDVSDHLPVAVSWIA